MLILTITVTPPHAFLSGADPTTSPNEPYDIVRSTTDRRPALRLLQRAKNPLPSAKLIVEMMEFLLQGKDPSDVAHRAAAALGLLPSVASTELCEDKVTKDADCVVELGPSTHAEESGTRFLKVELTDDNDHENNEFVNNIMGLARTVYGRTLVNQRLTDEAYTDALTSIWNRRGFLPLVDQAVARVARDHTCVSLMICDIDHFKEINDSLGHDAGDAALCDVTDAIQSVLRPSDLVARVGGDELAILLAGANSAGASKVADRLKEALIAQPSSVGKLTLSIGIADSSMIADGPSRQQRAQLFKLADEALYIAKRSGRDRSVVSPQPAADA
ncbi:MAG: GGDEF domain-containing protein [Nannocystaceae bacterium]